MEKSKGGKLLNMEDSRESDNEVRLDDKLSEFKDIYRAEIHWLRERVREGDFPRIEKKFKEIISRYPWLSRHKDCLKCKFEYQLWRADACIAIFIDLEKEEYPLNDILNSLNELVELVDPDFLYWGDIENKSDCNKDGKLDYWDELYNERDPIVDKSRFQVFSKCTYFAARKDRIDKKIFTTINPKRELENHCIFGTFRKFDRDASNVVIIWRKEKHIDKDATKKKLLKAIKRYPWFYYEDEFECLDVPEPSSVYCSISIDWKGATYRDVVNLVGVLDEIIDELDPDYVIYTNWGMHAEELAYPLPKKINNEIILSRLLFQYYSAIKKNLIDEKFEKRYLKRTGDGLVFEAYVDPEDLVDWGARVEELKKRKRCSRKKECIHIYEPLEERKNHYVYINKDLL